MRVTLIALSTLVLLAGCNKTSERDSNQEAFTSSHEGAYAANLVRNKKLLSDMEAVNEASLKAKRTLSFKNYFNQVVAKREESGQKRALGSGQKSLCGTMKDVGLGCSYEERISFSDYLAANGVNLFPCGDGLNPYFATKAECRGFGGADSLASFFIGQPGQNAKLERSIQANAGLFKNGDLTPEAASTWKD